MGRREWREMPLRVKVGAILCTAALWLMAAVSSICTIGGRAMEEERSARRELEVLYQLQRLQTAAESASTQIRGIS